MRTALCDSSPTVHVWDVHMHQVCAITTTHPPTASTNIENRTADLIQQINLDLSNLHLQVKQAKYLVCVEHRGTTGRQQWDTRSATLTHRVTTSAMLRWSIQVQMISPSSLHNFPTPSSHTFATWYVCSTATLCVQLHYMWFVVHRWTLLQGRNQTMGALKYRLSTSSSSLYLGNPTDFVLQRQILQRCVVVYFYVRCIRMTTCVYIPHRPRH